MLRRSLVVQSPKSVSAVPVGSPPSTWSRWVAFASRRWPTVLPNRAAPAHSHIIRLMVTVYADMAGYSRLFGLDDIGTVSRLQALHRDLIEPAIRRHEGRLVQTGGDSMLIVFESVAQAVKCAVTIQSGSAIDGDGWPRDRRMWFRIGVDLGDVIMDGMNFHGDGVIVATRLQAVCPPGGVCVSRAVHERGGERLGLPTQALGPLALKNVARPVEAFVLWPSRQETPKLLP
jgi:adenylate cyclase